MTTGGSTADRECLDCWGEILEHPSRRDAPTDPFPPAGPSGPVHVPEDILLEWRAFLQRDPETEAYWLKVGQMVRINSGPFASYNGFVADLTEAERLGQLIVEVMIFGRMAPVQLGLDQIE